MRPDDYGNDYVTLWVMGNAGEGTRILRTAKEAGVSGGTILFGKSFGTSNLLDFFGLDEYREEIVLMTTEAGTARDTVRRLQASLGHDPAEPLFAFTIPVCGIFGSNLMKSCKLTLVKEAEERGKEMRHQLITVIVVKGKGEDAIDAAIRAGSAGGTILNARGAGIHETTKVFAMEIEPEKEIALILSDETGTPAIIEAIRKDLRLDEPGNGILYVHQVEDVYGFNPRGSK